MRSLPDEAGAGARNRIYTIGANLALLGLIANASALHPIMPVSTFAINDPYDYTLGFDGYHQSEAISGIIPAGTSFNQRLKYDLYPERLSGTSFVTQRKDSKQTSLYRILPSTCHDDFQELPDHPLDRSSNGADSLKFRPHQDHWAPFKPELENDWLTGLRLIGGAGDPTTKNGVAYYLYSAGRSMPEHQAFNSVDGDFCIVSQEGALDIRTELGVVRVQPNELCVIPRGIRFNVALLESFARGFVLECFSGHFQLPELGPIGSVGLANSRDFQVPTASYVDHAGETEILTKLSGNMFRATYSGSIFNVVAWHGTYYPYKYDLLRFNAIGSISFDHPDPSIFTVLTCPSTIEGQPAADVVVFGPRWLVMEDSFRSPRYHRNTMSEFVFLVKGSFDVEPMPPQLAGMFGLTNSMSPHGPSKESYIKTSTKTLVPEKIGLENLGIMFESCFMIGTSDWVRGKAVKLPPKRGAYKEFERARLPST